MKALFLLFHGFNDSSGITKKIRYQIKALRECGLDIQSCYYEIDEDGNRGWWVDNVRLKNLGKGIKAKLQKRVSFQDIIQYVKTNNISFVYIRSYHNANPFTIRLVKGLKKAGCKTVMEIPTYPYDQEYSSLRMKLDLAIDRLYRKRLVSQLDSLITFSNASHIFGQRAIRISNGIDFDSIRLKRTIHHTSRELHLIGVAEIHYWHGFDRVIRGLANYYKTQPDLPVYFHLVGYFYSDREKHEILGPIRKYNLEKYVILYGSRHGEELDQLFEKADFAIGSLGRHRSGITHIKTLKNREYAARGIPFIYSETDEDFEQMPYILKATADDTPVDIDQIISFYRNLTSTPQQIRDSIRQLSWKCQMQQVLDELQITFNS